MPHAALQSGARCDRVDDREVMTTTMTSTSRQCFHEIGAQRRLLAQVRTHPMVRDACRIVSHLVTCRRRPTCITCINRATVHLTATASGQLPQQPAEVSIVSYIGAYLSTHSGTVFISADRPCVLLICYGGQAPFCRQKSTDFTVSCTACQTRISTLIRVVRYCSLSSRELRRKKKKRVINTVKISPHVSPVSSLMFYTC